MKKQSKPKVESKPEPRWIPASLEGAWVEEDGNRVTLRFDTGGYCGEWGHYKRKSVDVILNGTEQ